MSANRERRSACRHSSYPRHRPPAGLSAAVRAYTGLPNAVREFTGAKVRVLRPRPARRSSDADAGSPPRAAVRGHRCDRRRRQSTGRRLARRESHPCAGASTISAPPISVHPRFAPVCSWISIRKSSSPPNSAARNSAGSPCSASPPKGCACRLRPEPAAAGSGRWRANQPDFEVAAKLCQYRSRSGVARFPLSAPREIREGD